MTTALESTPADSIIDSQAPTIPSSEPILSSHPPLRGIALITLMLCTSGGVSPEQQIRALLPLHAAESMS